MAKVKLTLSECGDVLTPQECAQVLQLSRAQIYELVREKKLPRVEGIGTSVRIPRVAVQRLLEVAP